MVLIKWTEIQGVIKAPLVLLGRSVLERKVE